MATMPDGYFGPRVLCSHVKRAVAAVCGVSQDQIIGRGMVRPITVARQLGMLAAFRACGSVSQVAVAFARDRTTVEHGIRSAEALIERSASERDVFEEVERLAREFAAGLCARPRLYRGADDAGKSGTWGSIHERA